MAKSAPRPKSVVTRTRRLAVPASKLPPSDRAAAPFVAQPDLSRTLSDFEFTLIIVMYGFSRWVQTCMTASNVRGLSAVDILVLHAVNHRARDRRLHEICMVLNIDESHLVAYALKKLTAAGLVSSRTERREHHYSTTSQGDEACLAYRRTREEIPAKGLRRVAGGGPGPV